MNDNSLNGSSPDKIFVILAITVVMFFTGFLIGGSLIYGETSSEINDLEYQIQNLEFGYSDNELQSTTYYYYNETSLSSLYKQVKDSIVEISGVMTYWSYFRTQYTQVQGSGFIYEFNNEMFVITNNHVISDATDIVVTFSNGDGYPATIIGTDAYSDLAVLSIDAPIQEFKPLNIVSSSDLEVGDPVVAIGNPMGLDSTMTTGIVSQVGRTIEESLAGSFPIADIIQTNVAINPGNSGGPLLNYQGEVVGITTAIIEDSEGLGFAIPSNTIIREIESLILTGSYNEHPWLGVSGIDMTYYIADEINVNITYGWLIASVTSGSSADEAGLNGGNTQLQVIDEYVTTGGDIIIGIDDKIIINGDALMSYLEEYTQPGQTVNFKVIRDNQIIELPVTLGVRPSLN
jgi:S1-C subfamily serine protease